MATGFRVLLSAFLLMFVSAGVAQAAEGPAKTAGDATGRVIKLLKDEKGVYEKTPDAFFKDVGKIIDPVIAFDQMARGVMGKYAHRASEQEIRQFTSVFRDSLIRFYGKAILTFDTNQLSLGKVDPTPAAQLQEYESGKSRSVPVSLKINAKDTQYSISYSMVKVNAQWKVRNIIVEGINIGIQFRNQFGDAMNQYRKVGVVVEKWSELMQQNEKSQDSQNKELRQKEQGKASS